MKNWFTRLFSSSNHSHGGWLPNYTPQNELREMLITSGDLIIGADFLEIRDYPFQPSLAYQNPRIGSEMINDLDLDSCPPTVRVADELIFLTAEKRDELQAFCQKNNIEVVHRPDIWGWILEPFLDTEYTSKTAQRLDQLLLNYSLDGNQVKSIRRKVKTQMMKYNYDTLLWEWGHLGAVDVLKAMRTKYNVEEFAAFYQEVMHIALLTQPH